MGRLGQPPFRPEELFEIGQALGDRRLVRRDPLRAEQGRDDQRRDPGSLRSADQLPSSPCRGRRNPTALPTSSADRAGLIGPGQRRAERQSQQTGSLKSPTEKGATRMLVHVSSLKVSQRSPQILPGRNCKIRSSRRETATYSGDRD